MRLCAIYQLKNEKTGDLYIGSSFDPYGRWSSHMKKLMAGQAPKKLQENFTRIEDYSFRILKYVPQELRYKEERKFIDETGAQLNEWLPTPLSKEEREAKYKLIYDDILKKMNYRQIAAKHNVALGTVAKVRKWHYHKLEEGNR